MRKFERSSVSGPEPWTRMGRPPPRPSTRVLIECGPSRSIEPLYDALTEVGVDDLAVMAVTHIHLDHAGGAGHLAARFPGARIGLHAAGGRHLLAPDRLWDSATR